MNKLTKALYKKIEKDLVKKIGPKDANIILDKFGRGPSFLDTICLLPEWFYDSFSKNKERYNLELLGEANLKAWIGYTLYDYIRDGKISKDKEVKIISIANIYVQSALIIFTNQANSKLKEKQILQLFNKIDLFYIKYPDIVKTNNFNYFCSIIHEKSIAASISALLVIPNLNYNKSIKNILDFFKFYFTARQLSDDLDDYKKDLKFKIDTPVTLMTQQGLSGNDLKLFIRKKIDLNFNKAIKSLNCINDFNSKLFTDKYMKPC